MRQVRYCLYCFFPIVFRTSLRRIANAIAVTKVTAKLITPIASVFRIIRKKSHLKTTAETFAIRQTQSEKSVNRSVVLKSHQPAAQWEIVENDTINYNNSRPD